MFGRLGSFFSDIWDKITGGDEQELAPTKDEDYGTSWDDVDEIDDNSSHVDEWLFSQSDMPNKEDWASLEIDNYDDENVYQVIVTGFDDDSPIHVFSFTADDFSLTDFLKWIEDEWEGWLDVDIDIESGGGD